MSTSVDYKRLHNLLVFSDYLILFITAVSTPGNVEHGFVIKNSRLTSGADFEGVYLGRPWRNFVPVCIYKHRQGQSYHPERMAQLEQAGSSGDCFLW
ncbi:hypothetical protein [Rhodohalobacter sp. 8-1]|uniref:hypothetical protein n=1 Tax=Rhodohalobacter sp. 8-1 TaxID=3131972 RepID=UPI0030EB980A